MSTPPAAHGAPQGGFAALKHGAFVLAAALLFSPGVPPQAAPGQFPSSPGAARQVSPELRTQVVWLLDRPDAFPPYGSWWQPLGPAAFNVLEEVAANPRAPAPRRARAVTSMAAVDHPQALAHLRALLEDTGAEPPLRASAATALGLRVGQEAVPTLLPLLEDRDSQVRIAVARALGRLGGPQVQQALEERLPSEGEPLVREALQQGLTFLVP